MLDRRIARLGLAATLMLATSAQAQQTADPPDAARALLERVAERYQALETYYLEGVVSMEMTTGRGRQAMDLDVRMAERRPDLLRAEIRSPAVAMTVVTTADSTWMYLPAENRYLREAGRLPVQNPDSPVPDLLGEYQRIADGVAAVRLVGADTLSVGGTRRPAHVLAIDYVPRPSAAGAGADSSHRTVWVDAERLLVLEDRTRAYMADSPYGGAVTVRERVTFSDVRADEPLADSLFVFTPPPGAEPFGMDDVADAPPQAPEPVGLEGQLAPDFALENLDGETVRLSDLRGRVVLLNLWATWCGPCRVEMPALQELHEAYADNGLTVLGMNLEESRIEAEAYVDLFDYTFPIVLDRDGRVGAQYLAYSIPSTVVIGPDGVVSHHFMGARPEAVFREALRAHGIGADDE